MNAQNDKVVVQSPEWEGLDIPDYLRREKTIKEVLIPKEQNKKQNEDGQ